MFEPTKPALPRLRRPADAPGETGTTLGALRSSRKTVLLPAAELGGKGVVLIVDDEDSVARMLWHLLGSEGFTPEIASDGLAALERVRRAPKVDLVLLDIMMPGVDGFAVLRSLKADRATSSIPVLMVSARTDYLAERASKANGAVGLLSKPFAAADLLAHIERAVVRPSWANLLLEGIAQ